MRRTMASLQARIVGLTFPPVARWLFRDGVTVAKMRRPRVTQAPQGVRVEGVEVDGLRMEWLLPDAVGSERVLLFLHGGAWCSGSVDSHRALAGRLAKKLRLKTLHLTYRLAPEYPYPAALEDCIAACRWLVANGLSAADLVIAGNSAGGALAISTVLALRDAGESVPNSIVCFSPAVDLALTGSSLRRNSTRDLLFPEMMTQVVEWYVGRQDARDPLASPLYADFHGFPPLLVMAGDREMLMDDAIGLANRAREAGVAVTLRLWPGLIHTFEQMAFLPENKQAFDLVEAFLSQSASSSHSAGTDLR